MSSKEILKIVEEISKKLPKFPDGRINYSKSDVAPVITVFLMYGDEVLLMKRSDRVRTYRGKWNTVAGYLDEIKPLEEKVLEEIKEETEIERNAIESIKNGTIYSFKDEKINKTWIIQPVLVRLRDKPDIKLDWEHTDFRWVRIEDIDRFDTVPNLKTSLNNVIDD
ncbi:MAG TPA: NUDIX domain-containing protein [Archaeoglobaceae archaeon]|nr:NUDIX domain-containing protein [Archaeoglobaceae archaeon]